MWRVGWALRNEEPSSPEDLSGAKGWIPAPTSRDLSQREMPEIGRAGRRRLGFLERCVAQKPGREGPRVHSLKWPLLVARRRGRPTLPSGPAWLMMPRPRPSLASAPPPLQPCQSSSKRPRRGSPHEGSHCTVKTGAACCTACLAVLNAHLCTSVRPPAPQPLPSFCTERPSRPRPSTEGAPSPDLLLIRPLTPGGGSGWTENRPGRQPEQVLGCCWPRFLHFAL